MSPFSRVNLGGSPARGDRPSLSEQSRDSRGWLPRARRWTGQFGLFRFPWLPRARGWTPIRPHRWRSCRVAPPRAGMDRATRGCPLSPDVAPPRAGMDLRQTPALGCFGSGSPARGNGPWEGGETKPTDQRSPRVRGWSGPSVSCGRVMVVFPPRAGMVRSHPWLVQPLCGVHLAHGDSLGVPIAPRFFPGTRGWSWIFPQEVVGRPGFPQRARG